MMAMVAVTKMMMMRMMMMISCFDYKRRVQYTLH